MKVLAALVVIAMCIVVSGCSTAGPFVTNISSDGQGNLIIEKNVVRYNSFTGTIGLGNPITTTVRVTP